MARRKVRTVTTTSLPPPTLKALREWKAAGKTHQRDVAVRRSGGPRHAAAAEGAGWTLRRANVGRGKTGRFVRRRVA